MISDMKGKAFSEVRNIVTDIKGLVYKGSQNFKQNRGNILLTSEFRGKAFSEVINIVTDIKGLVYKGSQNFI